MNGRFRAMPAIALPAGGQTDIGIWSLRSNGAALWTRELNAQLVSNGAEVTFHPVAGGSVTFGYTVKDGVWVLLDRQTWAELARYVSPARTGGRG